MNQDDGRSDRVTTPEEFADLVARVRAGDSAAATLLVQRFEPAIRRAVRIRLADTRLRTAFDSMDLCQSILGSFFVRVSAGQYDLRSPDQLLRLLATMARNKVATRARHERADRRDNRRVSGTPVDEMAVPQGTPTPSRIVAGRELLARFRSSLAPDERAIADLRTQGAGWQEIADQLGGTPEGLRKKLSRACDRAAAELGLDDEI